MQYSSGFDFNKILDQTQYTYMPEKKFTKLEEKNKNVNRTENGKNMKLGLVCRLRPVVEWIAISEGIVGLILIILLMLLACHYDKLYGTENSRLISLMSFGGSVLLVINGMLLLTSLKLDKKKVMWYYILMSTLLWIYMFVLSVMKIHFALLVIERDTYKVHIPENRHFLLSNACVVGVVTMLGSVVHFIGNVTVFTFYNLKYIQPILFSCGP